MTEIILALKSLLCKDTPYDPPPVPDDEALVGLRAAAEELGVHYMTAYRYVRLGTLPAEKVSGAWQVRFGDIRALTEREPARPGPGGIRWGPYRNRLRDRLVAGDESGAWSVAVGVGSDDIVDAARHTTTLLHEQTPGIRVFVGGPAITTEHEARALGADEYGATALDVAVRCVELAAG